jgi:hypothetical protein
MALAAALAAFITLSLLSIYDCSNLSLSAFFEEV